MTKQTTIKDFCMLTSEKLWNMEKLIFPTKSNGEIRISEQEARFLFCQMVECNSKYFYSVETPTKNPYSFGGKTDDIDIGGRSGCIDLSIYEQQTINYEETKHLQPSLNIEFKALAAPLHCIAKDLFKLMHENANGLFFHLLKSANNGTLPNLLKKFNKSFVKLSQKNQHCNKHQTITFAICCLQPQFLLMVTLTKESLTRIAPFNKNSPFYIDYEISKGSIIKPSKKLELNGWEIVLLDKKTKENNRCK